MSRKTDNTPWMPSPECEAAYARALDTAHACAAMLWGERRPKNPEKDASARSLAMAMGMIYFMMRMDPRDMAALFTGPGSFADFDYKPFPPGYWLKKGVFADLAR